ncbi:hypothetical protein S245_020208, partial [Arachis hypogaea]
YEEDIVFLELTARRDVFRSLTPGKPIASLVLDLVADMIKIELTKESGYWFLPTTFALSEKTKLDPNCLPSCITDIYLDKVDCLKRDIYLDEVLEDRSFYDFETTPNLISSQFEFEEPEGLPTLEAGSTDAGVWVASWLIACFEDDYFNIK